MTSDLDHPITTAAEARELLGTVIQQMVNSHAPAKDLAGVVIDYLRLEDADELKRLDEKIEELKARIGYMGDWQENEE